MGTGPAWRTGPSDARRCTASRMRSGGPSPTDGPGSLGTTQRTPAARSWSSATRYPSRPAASRSRAAVSQGPSDRSMRSKASVTRPRAALAQPRTQGDALHRAFRGAGGEQLPGPARMPGTRDCRRRWFRKCPAGPRPAWRPVTWGAEPATSASVTSAQGVPASTRSQRSLKPPEHRGTGREAVRTP